MGDDAPPSLETCGRSVSLPAPPGITDAPSLPAAATGGALA